MKIGMKTVGFCFASKSSDLPARISTAPLAVHTITRAGPSHSDRPKRISKNRSPPSRQIQKKEKGGDHLSVHASIHTPSANCCCPFLCFCVCVCVCAVLGLLALLEKRSSPHIHLRFHTHTHIQRKQVTRFTVGHTKLGETTPTPLKKHASTLQPIDHPTRQGRARSHRTERIFGT